MGAVVCVGAYALGEREREIPGNVSHSRGVVAMPCRPRLIATEKFSSTELTSLGSETW